MAGGIVEGDFAGGLGGGVGGEAIETGVEVMAQFVLTGNEELADPGFSGGQPGRQCSGDARTQAALDGRG
jgi:hypothetical protein